MNLAMIKIQHCSKPSEESRQIIESSYSCSDIQRINKGLVDVENFLVAIINDKEVGVIAMKEEVKEIPLMYIRCLAVLTGEFWDDVIMNLVRGAKAYADRLGFHEVHIVESREWYIEFLKTAGLQTTMEYLHLERDLTSIPQPRSPVIVKRIPGDVRSFVDTWSRVVGSGSPEDFPDFPPITEEYIRRKLPELDPESWIIALHGDEPCGLITVSRDGSLGDLMVSKSHRRMGIGTALAIEALRYLKNSGSEKATLQVRAGNTEALKLYQNLGFVVHKREIEMIAQISQ